MENYYIVKGYTVYLPIVIGLTYYVAHTLFKNGKVFMMDIFKGRQEIALATNTLFKVGFYLLNLGFALMILKIVDSEYNPLDTYQELIEVLSTKIGGFSIYLGIMLFLNLLLFFRGKKKAKQSTVKPQPVTIYKAPVNKPPGE
ncbi:hypothetical protein JYT14_00675 [Flavobacteriales bacterium AH-315-E23]|nr:hypothetical protein [Flavobacteriales bacterium AH-315-E23]